MDPHHHRPAPVVAAGVNTFSERQSSAAGIDDAPSACSRSPNSCGACARVRRGVELAVPLGDERRRAEPLGRRVADPLEHRRRRAATRARDRTGCDVTRCPLVDSRRVQGPHIVPTGNVCGSVGSGCTVSSGAAVRRGWALASVVRRRDRPDRAEPVAGSGRFGRGQHHLLPAEHDLQRALHPHRRGHDDRSRRHAVGGHGARSAVPQRSGGADRRSVPDRQGQRHRRPLLRSRSATTCGPATTCTSPTRTTATRTSTCRSREQTHARAGGRRSATARGSATAPSVLPGARIGRHVTVGANSVVTGDLPDYCVAVGAPGTDRPPPRDGAWKPGARPRSSGRRSSTPASRDLGVAAELARRRAAADLVARW